MTSSRKHLSPEIQKKIRQLTITTQRLLSGALVGDSRSAIRGSGFEFDQTREYRMGDDIRFIDWNATARSQHVLVKEYIEERSRTIMLLVDISGSTDIGSGEVNKREKMAEIASVLSLVSEYARDRVGLILFSDVVECYIPPNQGTAHVHVIMDALFGRKAQGKGTAIDSALKQLMLCKERDILAFLISDCAQDNEQFQRHLVMAHQKCDVTIIRVSDAIEYDMPIAGFLMVEDAEQSGSFMLDLRKVGSQYLNAFLHEHKAMQDKMFTRRGVGVLDITCQKPFMADLIRFFRRKCQY